VLISRVGPRLAALLHALGRKKRLRRAMPGFVETWIGRAIPMADYGQRRLTLAGVRADVEPVSTYVPRHPWLLGIVAEPSDDHLNYVNACRELRVSYKVLDIFRSDWVRVFAESGCDAYLTSCCETPGVWKRLYDDRLRFLAHDLGKMLYPPYDAVWLYASKHRGSEWLRIHGFPFPPTWVFHREDEAMDFAATSSYPKVVKMDNGASSSGVWIVRDQKTARRFIRKAFGRGLRPKDSDGRDSQWGSILFQEYIPDAIEWRVIRIGKSYLGYEKIRRGDFHSGTGLSRWEPPPDEALRLTSRIVDAGGFDCMAVDILQSQEGRFFVNELQTFFGTVDTAQMYSGGRPGRLLYVRASDSWEFEEGRFGRNACSNLRVESLLEMLAQRHARQVGRE
jgi:glutathione synthase/RimK-type ligase-like ATP-grasp enzyme